MATGDSVGTLVSKTNNSTLDIQPGVGAEWFVHSLFSEQGLSMEVYRVDDATGTNKKKTMTLVGGEAQRLTMRVTNDRWIQLKNVSGSTQFIGYEGVITK
jgi:cytoskeletal protein RodZ